MIELQQNETIVAVYRRHWFHGAVLVVQAAIGILLVALAPIVARTFISKFFIAYESLWFLVVILIIELLWTMFFVAIADYYLDAWIITNERVTFIELRGIFHRSVSSVRLENIQDVSVEVNGIIPTLFHFGNVKIHSAGMTESFVCRQVPNPYAVKDLIFATRKEKTNPV